MNGISLYIHIPFCVRKCAYCDFLSAANFEVLPEYITALQNEIMAFETEAAVKTVFIGGGTPSAVAPEYIENIMNAAAKKFSFSENCEITIESNPGTLTDEKLSAYRALGIDRLSMGVQSMDDRLLKSLGRIHGKKDVLQSYVSARRYFDNINLDLMFALPSQTCGDWDNTLKEVIKLAPEHISAYSLIIEEGTPFYERYSSVDDETDRSMYYHARNILAKNGYTQYEISNFSKPEKECRHNLVYWQGGDYKGFGLGAASLIKNARLKNTEDMREYLSGTCVTECIELDTLEQMQEFVLLGLRCTKGIFAETFRQRFGKDIFDTFGNILKKHEKNGLLEINGGNIKLTERGMDISNTVFIDFV